MPIVQHVEYKKMPCIHIEHTTTSTHTSATKHSTSKTRKRKKPNKNTSHKHMRVEHRHLCMYISVGLLVWKSIIQSKWNEINNVWVNISIFLPLLISLTAIEKEIQSTLYPPVPFTLAHQQQGERENQQNRAVTTRTENNCMRLYGCE